VKRTAVSSPDMPSLVGKSIDASIVSVHGTTSSSLSLDDVSLHDQHVPLAEGSNVNSDHQKVTGLKQNPNSSVTPSDKDDLSTIGGNSRASEDHNSMLAMSMYEFSLDDDDDNSYLEGSVNHPVVVPTMGTAGASKMAELAVKKEQTIENVYWPFHRYYDLNGYRRMIPCRCTKCGEVVPCSCEKDKAIRQGFKIPDFVLPLSDRKDGGLSMDTTGFKMPLKQKGPNGRDQHYDGKIFYMGIIDILQQYNLRKRIEARYRRIKGSGWKDASCVHPSVYAERFIAFFDEYSQRSPPSTETPLQEGEEAIVFFDPKRDNEDTKEEI
jgi:Phosphatidylinositol-4-phosphate 5-Kinase